MPSLSSLGNLLQDTHIVFQKGDIDNCAHFWLGMQYHLKYKCTTLASFPLFSLGLCDLYVPLELYCKLIFLLETHFQRNMDLIFISYLLKLTLINSVKLLNCAPPTVFLVRLKMPQHMLRSTLDRYRIEMNLYKLWHFGLQKHRYKIMSTGRQIVSLHLMHPLLKLMISSLLNRIFVYSILHTGKLSTKKKYIFLHMWPSITKQHGSRLVHVSGLKFTLNPINTWRDGKLLQLWSLFPCA